jgi:hypothetical protein
VQESPHFSPSKASKLNEKTNPKPFGFGFFLWAKEGNNFRLDFFYKTYKSGKKQLTSF